MVSTLSSQLLQVEDILTGVSEDPEELLLLPGLAGLDLLLLEGDDNLAIFGKRAGQPRASILVFIHEKYFQVVKEYENGVDNRCQVQNLYNE